MHMAANLFQVKTEMLKTDLTNLSKLLPDSPGFFILAATRHPSTMQLETLWNEVNIFIHISC